MEDLVDHLEDSHRFDRPAAERRATETMMDAKASALAKTQPTTRTPTRTESNGNEDRSLSPITAKRTCGTCGGKGHRRDHCPKAAKPPTASVPSARGPRRRQRLPTPRPSASRAPVSTPAVDTGSLVARFEQLVAEERRGVQAAAELRRIRELLRKR
jgi:hypothetical protein